MVDTTKMLQGRYEAERLPVDFSPECMFPDFGFNVLNLESPLYRPVVDEQDLGFARQKPSWPDGKPFVVCLTHDVDSVSARSVRQDLRRALRTARLESQTSKSSGLKALIKGVLPAISNAAAQGLAVTELTPPDRKASAEMLTLFRYLFDSKSPSTR